MATALIPLDGEILDPVRPERKVDARQYEVEEGLTVADCCRMFEEAEEASQSARELAERDRDYYDGKQLTAEQEAELRKRGQPAVVLNMIRQKINFLVGLEKQQRTKPRSLPRTPVHENDAHACTDALRFVTETEKFQEIRSAVWRNMLIEGAGACCVTVTPKQGADVVPMAGGMMAPQGPQFDVKLRYYSYDRFFADPHSSRLDYSDANYLGTVIWMDKADAFAMYGPEYTDVIDTTLETASTSDTYGDRPSWLVWADRKRKRIRVVQMWIKRNEEWYFAEFTKGGFLKTGSSPYMDENGKTDCEIVAQSAYCDRENNRYGEVRELVSPQDEINKRRSKSLHILNTNQVVAEEGAVMDEEVARREANKPDGWITLAPGGTDKFKFQTRGDMADGQFKLLQHTMDVFALMGPNASMEGDTGKTASGRAILASQQGGMIQMGDLTDNLRTFDRNVYRAIWNRIRQYWTGPMWVRVTDDERNIRFAGINGAPDPVTGQPGPMVAQLDVDIIIDDAPDGVAPAIEQFNALVELKKFDVGNELSFRTILEAMPNLRNKDKILDSMDQAKQQVQQQGPPPEVQAEIARLQIEQQRSQQQMELEQQKAVAAAEQAQMKMETDRQIALMKAQLEDEMAQRKAERDEAVAMANLEIKRQTAAANGAISASKASESDEPEPGEPSGPSQEDTNLALAAALEHIAQAMMAPKKIIRDDQGRAAGVAPVRQIERAD
jgi:hypothetical protein